MLLRTSWVLFDRSSYSKLQNKTRSVIVYWSCAIIAMQYRNIMSVYVFSLVAYESIIFKHWTNKYITSTPVGSPALFMIHIFKTLEPFVRLNVIITKWRFWLHNASFPPNLHCNINRFYYAKSYFPLFNYISKYILCVNDEVRGCWESI